MTSVTVLPSTTAAGDVVGVRRREAGLRGEVRHRQADDSLHLLILGLVVLLGGAAIIAPVEGDSHYPVTRGRAAPVLPTIFPAWS